MVATIPDDGANVRCADEAARGSPPAPSVAELPSPRTRTQRSGRESTEIALEIEVVTPILGGSCRPRALDEIDVIRAASVRGHLRFWWRALRGSECADSRDLYAKESELWGRSADDDGGRSAVALRIEVLNRGQEDASDPNGPTGAYALWPARAETRTKRPAAPRRLQGTRFVLTLLAPQGMEAELRATLKAWLVFGGYGGRTRRGLGSLSVSKGRADWLPSAASREALGVLFGSDLFASGMLSASDLPVLAGAGLLVGNPMKAELAWTTALNWLRDFRQGSDGGAGHRARELGSNGRPGRSNWPEADKVRLLSTPTRGLAWAHKPRHNHEPTWPRAGFGLPIGGRFQNRSRDQRPGGKRGDTLKWDELSPPRTEPGDFQIRWSNDKGMQDRLASPVILKALPLADGLFAPCALWLHRAYPSNGKVVLSRPSGSGFVKVDRSSAPFDHLVAPGDPALFGALAGKATLRDAFLDWLVSTKSAKVVAP